MPIITLELIGDDQDIDDARIQRLADRLGDAFGSPPGTTWLRVRTLHPTRYAENAADTGDLQPVFVEIIERSLPSHDDLAERARQIAATVADCLDRPAEHVHVIYAPPGAGRIAFGGELLPP